MAQLIVFRGRRKLATHQLDRREFVLGRGEDVDIQIDNPLVSRRHARVCFRDGAWRVEDLDTPNGLYVNGNRVQYQELQPGDRIELGQHFVVFEGSAANLDIATVPDDHHGQVDREEPTAVLPPREIESIIRKVRSRTKTHLVIEHEGRRWEVALSNATHLVGFDESCDVRLAGSALFGKQVAELVRQDDGGYAVVSLSSLAPVRVNGQKVSTGHLEDGDQIQIKGATLRYHDDLSG